MTQTFPSSLDLHRPGTWIAGPDRDWASKTALVLSMIEGEFERAVASWSAFDPIRVAHATGPVASKHIRCLQQIFAREYVLSLDSIQKLMPKLPDPPDSVTKYVGEYEAAFGTLKHIRDSFAHIEDRGLAKGKWKTDLQTPVVVLGCFVGDRFEFTGSDSRRYGIEVSYRTLAGAHRILQSLLESYAWN